MGDTPSKQGKRKPDTGAVRVGDLPYNQTDFNDRGMEPQVDESGGGKTQVPESDEGTIPGDRSNIENTKVPESNQGNTEIHESNEGSTWHDGSNMDNTRVHESNEGSTQERVSNEENREVNVSNQVNSEESEHAEGQIAETEVNKGRDESLSMEGASQEDKGDNKDMNGDVGRDKEPIKVPVSSDIKDGVGQSKEALNRSQDQKLDVVLGTDNYKGSDMPSQVTQGSKNDAQNEADSAQNKLKILHEKDRDDTTKHDEGVKDSNKSNEAASVSNVTSPPETRKSEGEEGIDKNKQIIEENDILFGDSGANTSGDQTQDNYTEINKKSDQEKQDKIAELSKLKKLFVGNRAINAIKTKLGYKDSYEVQKQSEKQTEKQTEKQSEQGESVEVVESDKHVSDVSDCSTETTKSKRKGGKLSFGERISTTLSKVDLEQCDPDVCVDLIKMPAVRTYAALKR